MLQREYTSEDFVTLRNQSNINLLNISDIANKAMVDISAEIKRLASLTDKLSNLTVIAGDTYFYNKDLKVIESKGAVYEEGVLKLKPSLSYRLEPKEGGNKLITDKSVRISDGKRLMSIDDLLVRRTPIQLKTTENAYKYTISLSFNSVMQYNNISLKLNAKTESYPKIAEVYYINSKREKKSIKLLNNLYSFDIDLHKNSENLYSVNTEIVFSDNLFIVFEDNLQALLIDSLDVCYMEYPDEGYVIFEAVESDKPILKVGLEARGHIEASAFSLSHDRLSWLPLSISNTYSIEKDSKVIAYNTISNTSIKTSTDVKKLFIKATLKAITETHMPSAKIDKSVHTTASIPVSEIFSVYENISATFYGETSFHNRFNFEDLYDNGEYLLIDNKYYIKGFIDSDISRVRESKYSYAPVKLKAKELRVAGDVLSYDSIDISTKEVYTFGIERTKKSLLATEGLSFILPLKPSYKEGIYYLMQGGQEIEVNLSLGFINSAIDVLYAIDPKGAPVVLADNEKKPILTLSPFKLGDTDVVSLLSLFEAEGVSPTFPLEGLSDQLGLLDNVLHSNRADREVEVFILSKRKLYTEDHISSKNKNYSQILDDIPSREVSEQLPKYKKQYKLSKGGLVSVAPFGASEMPFINGYSEFLEYFSREITLPLTAGVHKIELDEDKILEDTLTWTGDASVRLIKEDRWYAEIEVTAGTSVSLFYTYENTAPKGLYSVDYPNGLVFFSELVDTDLSVTYRISHLLTTGKKARQMKEEEYSLSENSLTIRNPKDNATIFLLSKKTSIEHRNVTPLVHSLKVNYLLKDERSL